MKLKGFYIAFLNLANSGLFKHICGISCNQDRTSPNS